MAAIATLDAAVVASGGEVITLADRQAAITELDAAVAATELTFPRLAKAIAETQRVRAWDADEGFGAALAAGTIEIETDTRGDSRGIFAIWAQHRYQWKSAHAMGMARAGRVLGVLDDPRATARGLPTNERQVRPLTRLLDKHEDSIPKVWEQAINEAEADRKPQSVARYVDHIIRDAWPELFEKSADDAEADLDRQLRQFRSLFRSLHGRMNHSDFADRVIDWINEEVGE